MSSRAYTPRRRPRQSEQTRERVLAAVRELLHEGTFHESTVEEVADRAGIARATLYQHFGSRLGLIDAICDTFSVNPALVALREAVEAPDVERALADTVDLAVRFWMSEDGVLKQIYGVAAIDPAAADLVDRQRADRRGEMQKLVQRLADSGRIASGLSQREALARLMVLTSYDAYRELKAAGQSDRDVARTLRASALSMLTESA